MNTSGLRLWGAALLCLVPALPALAELMTIDPMESPSVWMILDDNQAKGSTSPAAGPDGAKALELKYDLSSGNWVAWVRETKNGLKGLKAILFEYKGTGSANLELKVTDSSGATFGRKIPGGAGQASWKKVTVAVEDLQYLWGGNTQTLNPDNLRKLEFTLSSDAGGGPGTVTLTGLRYSTTAMASSLPKEETPPPPPGKQDTKVGFKPATVGAWPQGANVEITADKGWKRFMDQGAALTVGPVDGPEKGQKAVQASFTWGPREVRGVKPQTGNWCAVVSEFQYDLSESRDLSFIFKSTGAVANLEIKIKDINDTVFGRTYPSGSSLPNWTAISVPRSDFKYLWGGDGSGKFDWAHVKALEFTLTRTDDPRDNGAFLASGIRFTSAVGRTAAAPVPVEAGPTTTDLPGQVKIVIDDFTDLNPTNRYFVVPGDDSSLALQSSRITFIADYSMMLQYVLSSARPTGSWVEAERRFQPPLDWSGVEAVKVWVKGDGSRNIFRFTVTDGEGRRWVYDDEEVLASTSWLLVDMPIASFTLYQDLFRKGRSLDLLKNKLSSIRAFSFGIVSQPNRSSNVRGEVFVENLYLAGRGINEGRAVPLLEKPPIGFIVPLKNWNIGGTSNSKLEIIPDNGTNLYQNLLLRMTGNFEKFSVLGEIRLDSTFGTEADGIRAKDGTLTSPNTSITLLDPMEGFSNVIVGNLWFNSSPHIFANDNAYGGWGFRGLMAEGWVGKLHHRTYFLKHAPDSYTLAGHYAATLDALNINLIGTYFNQQPFLATATRLEQDDKALLLDLNQRFKVPGVLTLTPHLSIGVDWFQKYWDVTTQTPDPLATRGAFLEGELNLSEMDAILWPGFSLTGRYRYVEPDFKPTFRQSPGYWDNEVGDQKSYSLRAYQTALGAFIAGEYTRVDRLSSPGQASDRTVLSVGYNNWSSVDISLSQERGVRKYNYFDPRYLWHGLPALLYDNRQEDITTLNVAYHLSSLVIISEWLQYKRLHQFDTEDKYSEMFAVTRVQYYPAPNLVFTLENKFSRLGREQDVNVVNLADVYSIAHYTRVMIDLTF